MAANALKTKKEPVKKEKKEPGKIALLFRRIGRFFVELRSELRRVIWPDRKKLVSSTVIVLAIVVSAGVFLWLVDSLLMGILNGVGFYNTQSTTAATTAAAATTSGTTVSTTVSTSATTTAAGTTAATTAKP
jgi:preprotein translocase subunit SecE